MNQQDSTAQLIDILLLFDNLHIAIDRKTIKNIITNNSIDEIIKYCQDNSKMKFFKLLREEDYLLITKSGKMLLEELLDKKIEISYNKEFKSKEILATILKYKRYDLLYMVDMEMLLSNYINGQTLFDLMLEKQNNGINMNLEKCPYQYKEHNTKITAIKLIKLARNNLIGYEPEINDKLLLYKGNDDNKSILSWLVEMDRQITIQKILPQCNEIIGTDLGLVLRNLGIDNTLININNNDRKYYDNYIEETNNNITNGLSVYQDLLNELKKLFYKDGLSDKKFVDILIKSYKGLTLQKNDLMEKEIRQLIAIKKDFPSTFVYTNTDQRSCFKILEGIKIQYNVPSTVIHETSHALHYYLSNYYVPSNINEVIERIRNNPKTIKKVRDFSIKFNELRNQIKDNLPQKEISDYYDLFYTGDKIIELASFLSDSKEKQKERFRQDYNEQILDTILAKTYSVDEFIKNRKEIELLELYSLKFGNTYPEILAIGDIIDAIFDGKLRNGVLTDDSGFYIKKVNGHGIKYYAIYKNVFIEMIANYGTILKSKNRSKIFSYLRSIVGDELVNLLKDVYENNILDSKAYIHDLEGENKHAR